MLISRNALARRLRRGVAAVSVGLLLFGVAVPLVRADGCPDGMSTLDCQALFGNWANWIPETGDQSACSTDTTDSDSTAAAGGSSATLPPNASAAFTYFTSHGYSAAQTAGLVGNFWYESNIDPTARNGSGAYGIAQWLDRYPAMKAWVTGEGKQYTSLEGQMDFVIHELNTNEGAAKTDLLKQTDPRKAAFSVYKYYERPNDGTYPDREDDATKLYNALADQAAAPGGNDCSGGESVDCTTASGTAKILCEAEAYNGIYYRWGGGHQGYDAFVAGCPDPSNPPNNQPSGSPNDPTNGGLSGNPSPCATDCSGLVSIAVDAAFNQKLGWSVSSLESSAQWKAIAKTAVQPGDVLTIGSDHVEIVDSYSGGANVTTFGSHKTGTKTSRAVTPMSMWTGAYRYVGPM